MARKTELDREVARILKEPYARVLIPDAQDGGYVAEVLELPGCITQGDTADDAMANLDDAMAGWIAVSLEAGRAIPEPLGMKEYSGRFPLRISSELHRNAALRAMWEGVSLNQWIGQALAEKLAGSAQAAAKYAVPSRRRRTTRVADR